MSKRPKIDLSTDTTKTKLENPNIVIVNDQSNQDEVHDWIRTSSPFQTNTLFEPTYIADEIKEIDEEKRAKRLENDAKQQDIDLKKKTLNRLFLLLCAETVVVFIFAYWQGRENNKFTIDQWSFRLIISATILQITTMLIYAVRHLFPNNSDH